MFNKNTDYKKIKPNTDFVGQNIVYYKIIDSTNNVAKKADCKEGTLFLAEKQTNGKGRMGRSWLSEKNIGIWMSIVLIPNMKAEHINQLTLVTGLAVCETLTELYNLPFKIKWPNDIVIDDKKVCGILAESVSGGDESPKIIDGIGINVNTKTFPDDLKDKATSIRILTGKKTDRTEIINRFCEVFERYYKDFTTKGMADIIEKYKKVCVTINNEITVIKDSEKINAIATGITDIGELIIKKEDGTTLNIGSGEVSVRGIYGYI